MAGLKGTAATATEVGLVAATPKTVLRVTAPTNQGVIVNGINIAFDGVTLNAEPVVVRLRKSTTTGSGTTVTPVKRRPHPGTIQSTSLSHFTVEPTQTDILDQWEIHPTAGLDIWYPLGEEPVIAGGERLGIVVTSPAAVNCHATIRFEE